MSDTFYTPHSQSAMIFHARDLELNLETKNDIIIEEFNVMVSSVASSTLKSTYRIEEDY